MDTFWIIAIGFVAIVLYHTVRWYLGMAPDMSSTDSSDSDWSIDLSDSSDSGGD